jgi:hypothetical protein
MSTPTHSPIRPRSPPTALPILRAFAKEVALWDLPSANGVLPRYWPLYATTLNGDYHLTVAAKREPSLAHRPAPHLSKPSILGLAQGGWLQIALQRPAHIPEAWSVRSPPAVPIGAERTLITSRHQAGLGFAHRGWWEGHRILEHRQSRPMLMAFAKA